MNTPTLPSSDNRFARQAIQYLARLFGRESARSTTIQSANVVVNNDADKRRRRIPTLSAVGTLSASVFGKCGEPPTAIRAKVILASRATINNATSAPRPRIGRAAFKSSQRVVVIR
jgi:hypothetical protein